MHFPSNMNKQNDIVLNNSLRIVHQTYLQLHRAAVTNYGEGEANRGLRTAKIGKQMYLLLCLDGEILCAVSLKITKFNKNDARVNE